MNIYWSMYVCTVLRLPSSFVGLYESVFQVKNFTSLHVWVYVYTKKMSSYKIQCAVNVRQRGVCPAEGGFSPSPLWTGTIWFHLGYISPWRGTRLVSARNLTLKWKINVTVELQRVWLFFTQGGNMKQDVRILLLGERKSFALTADHKLKD